MAGLYTGAIGLWGGLPGLISSTTLSTPPSLLANVGGIAATGANLALWFDENQAYKSSGGGIVTPDSILTYTAPSPKLVYGADGVLGYAPHNLLSYSEQFNDATWTQVGVTISADAAVAPDGTMTAERIVVDTSTNLKTTSRTLTVVSGNTYTQSIYLKPDQITTHVFRRSVGERVTFNLTDRTAIITGTLFTACGVQELADGWLRCWGTFVPASTSFIVFHGPSGSNTTGNDTDGYWQWGAQVSNGANLLTYVPTTTAAVYSLPRDYNPTTGAALGVLVEEARTNLCLYSDDFTNVAWVKSNLTAAKTATGPDGAANSASTLTATAANGVARQAISSVSAARSGSVYLKRRTGTGAVTIAIGETTGSELVVNGTFATDVTGWTDQVGSASASVSGAINVTTTIADTWTYQAVAVTVGKLYRVSFDWTQKQGGGRFYVGTLIGSGELASATTAATGRIIYFVATAATIYISLGDEVNGGGTVNIYDNISLFEVAEATVDLSSGAWVRGSIENKTITNPFFAIKLATSADAVDVAIADLENGAFITSPIPTVASQVTRAADQISILTSAFPYNVDEWTYVVEADVLSVTSPVLRVAVDLNSTTGAGSTRADIYAKASDGAVGSLVYDAVGAAQLFNETGAAFTVGVLKKIALAVKINDMARVIDGGAVLADTSTGAMRTYTTLGVGSIAGGTSVWNGHIKRLAYYASRKTNAELQVLST